MDKDLSTKELTIYSVCGTILLSLLIWGVWSVNWTSPPRQPASVRKTPFIPKNEREAESYEQGKRWKQRARGFVRGFLDDKGSNIEGIEDNN